MKASRTSVGALALAGLFVLALGPPDATAQGEGSSTAAKAFQPPATDAMSDRLALAHKRIRAALDQEVELNYLDTPLSDVAQHLSKITGVRVILSTRTLADAAVTADTPVTSSLKGISLRSALRIMLGELKLAYVIRDEVLQITTPEDAEGELFTRVYDCRQLIALKDPPGTLEERGLQGRAGDAGTAPAASPPPAAVESATGSNEAPGTTLPPPDEKTNGAGEKQKATAPNSSAGGFCGSVHHAAPYHRLIDMITSTVDPDKWEEVGGPGTITEYKGLLAISQTAEVQDEVERLLNMLHQAAGLEEQRVKVVE